MPQLPPIDRKRLAIDRRRDGRFRHHRVRRGFAFVAQEGAAIGARYEPADLPIMLPAERAARAPLGVQISRHAFTIHATLTTDAACQTTVAAGAFADPSAKNDRREPNGYIGLGNKRAGAPGKPKPGEIAVDIDRKNRILGNPFIPRDATDKAARADVIERFRAKYQADPACDGPMAAATQPSPSA
jgi:hypothetical protein